MVVNLNRILPNKIIHYSETLTEFTLNIVICYCAFFLQSMVILIL